MSSTDYIFLSAAVTCAVFLAALTLKKPEPTIPPAQETTRWKRFRIQLGAIHGILREACTAVLEEPSGLKLLAAPRDGTSGKRLRILGGQGQTVIELVRGRLLFHRRLRVLVLGRDWLHLRLPRPGEKKLEMRFLSSIESFEVLGNLQGREYEVRRKGRLVANVSWQHPEDQRPIRKDYVLECLKSEDPLPLIALVLGIETALCTSK